MDADARAYIAALETAGATVTSGQRTAINDFVEGEKAGSRWTSHKRLYLPIWGVAAANAICMKSLTSGTFVGGVTHGAGYVKGDGTTGYFNTGVSVSALGATNTSLLIAVLALVADTRTDLRFFGSAYMSATQEFGLGSSSSAALRFDAFNNSTGQKAVSLTRSSHTGIITTCRNSSGWEIRRRITSGVASLHSSIGVGVGNLPTVNTYFSAQNFNNSAQSFNDAQFGVYVKSLELTNTQTDYFTLALKTLWETCTGLLLP